jgi:hypothetical protein
MTATSHSVFICMGMCWTHPTDAVRLRSLQRISNAKVISVSQSTQLNNENHVECDFRTERGLKSIINRTAKYPDAEITCILDYWWLARNYYTHCYGIDWLSRKCAILLKSGVSSVILPVDRDPESNMTIMLLAQNRSPNIRLSFINLMDNPLFVASESSDVTNACMSFGRQDNIGNVESYLNKATPFLRIHALE